MPGILQKRNRVGIAEGSSGYRGRGGQYWEKIRFIEEPWVQDEGGRHVAKRNSDLRVAYPEVKLQRRDLVRVEDIVAPFVPRGAVPGENRRVQWVGSAGSVLGEVRFIEKPWVKDVGVAMWLNVFLTPA